MTFMHVLESSYWIRTGCSSGAFIRHVGCTAPVPDEVGNRAAVLGA